MGSHDAAATNEQSFSPPRLLRSPHVQTMLASSPLRKLLLVNPARYLRRTQQEVILEVPDGVRLHGLFNPGVAPNGQMVILLHGWEGCAESCYMVASARQLLGLGYDVFRLHLRDHGPSHGLGLGYDVFRLHLRDHGPAHGLNRELFNSTRLDAVVAAVTRIQQLYERSATYLVGFSLGGNFALRCAARMVGQAEQLRRVIAICPVLNPVATMDALCARHNRVYERYFKYRWRRSLEKKLRHHPELGYQGVFDQLPNLREMNRYFVPNYTEFGDEASYLRAYAITGNVLDKIAVPCHMLLSADDPIIPLADLKQVATPDQLSVEIAPFGGHVGFIKNWRLHSWLDERLPELLAARAAEPCDPAVLLRTPAL